MATYNKFEQFVEDLGNKVHDFRATGDTLKVALTNTAPVTTNAVFADITEIAAGNGYVAGGADIANDYTEAAGVGTLTGVDVTWTAAGGSIGPFQYVVLYNDTPTSPADPLIAWWARNSALTLSDGESFTVDFGANIFSIT